MNVWSTYGFGAGFAVVGALLLIVLFATRHRWWVKLVAIAMVAALGFATWQSLPTLLGWPAAHGLPPRFNLVGLHLIEPDKSGTTKGRIYLWVTDIGLGPASRTPRAIELPFDAKLQLKLGAAGTKLRKNLPQLGEILQSTARDAHGGRAPLDIDFYDMPDPLFPEQ